MIPFLARTLRRLKNLAPLQSVTMSSSASSYTFIIGHDEKNEQFTIHIGPEKVGVLQYEENPKGVLDMYHTEVVSSFRGNGIGNILAEVAFKYVVHHDHKMKLSCTFLQKFIKENPKEEYEKRILPVLQRK